MQIGEQDLAGAELLALGRQRLLDLDDQFGAGENRVGIGDDLGAGGRIVGVGQAGAQRRHRVSTSDLMVLGGELAHRRGHQADAVFVVLDLLGDADQHL